MPLHLFVSDLHASLRLPHARVSGDGTTSDRLLDVLGVLEAMRDHEPAPEAYWILGDLFDKRHPDAPTLKYVSRCLHELSERAPVYLLPGNHDAHGRNAAVYSLSMFEELKLNGIRAICEPQWISHGAANFFAVPWLPEERFPEAIEYAIDWHDPEDIRPRILLMHQTVSGATSNGQVLSGLSPGVINPSLDDGEPLFDFILSGHIHAPQTFARGRGQYLGSPLPLSFGEADGLERGFWELDTPNITPYRHTLYDTPEFVTWRFSGAVYPVMGTYRMLGEELLDELEALLDIREVYLDVRITGPRVEVDEIAADVSEKIRELEEQTDRLRLWRLNRIVTDDGSDRIREAASDGTLTPEELVGLYVDVNESIIPDGVEVEKLRKLGRELVEGA